MGAPGDGRARQPRRLLINSMIQRAEGAASGMAVIERLTDADMAEAEQSRSEYDDVEARTKPIRKFMDFWHALKWLNLSKEQQQARDSLLDGSLAMSSWWLPGWKCRTRQTDEAIRSLRGRRCPDPASLADETAKVRTYVLARDLIDKRPCARRRGALPALADRLPARLDPLDRFRAAWRL